MQRRTFLQLAGAAAVAWPIPVLANQRATLPMVAVLIPFTEDIATPLREGTRANGATHLACAN